MSNASLVGWVALCLLPRVGGRTLSALLDVFGTPTAVFEASHQDLLAVKRIGTKTIEAIESIDLAIVAQQIDQWQKQGIALITWQDVRYPEPFKDLRDRPPLLFARGNLQQDWSKVVAIVGTRQPSDTGVLFAETLAYELTQRGWLVVSGLALGIDAAGHRGALAADRTVAFVGCGVDALHPLRNRTLGETILRQGAVFAEVPPQTIPSAGSLMARNRLISGAAKATFVIEAGLQSGSMEAARRARQQQRHVFTLDMAIWAGNQALLQSGAIPLGTDFMEWDGLAAQLMALPDPPRQLRLF